MDENTQRIRESIAEARSRQESGAVKLDTDAVLSDLEYLLEQNALLEVDNAVGLGARVRLISEARNARKATEANRSMAADYGATIKGMATQINNTMGALNAAGIQDVAGPEETRTARRIAMLTAQRKDARTLFATAKELRKDAERNLAAAEGIIAETHEALNVGKVSLGNGGLRTRVEAALAMHPMPGGGQGMALKVRHQSSPLFIADFE